MVVDAKGGAGAKTSLPLSYSPPQPPVRAIMGMNKKNDPNSKVKGIKSFNLGGSKYLGFSGVENHGLENLAISPKNIVSEWMGCLEKG